MEIKFMTYNHIFPEFLSCAFFYEPLSSQSMDRIKLLNMKTTSGLYKHFSQGEVVFWIWYYYYLMIKNYHDLG
jgi:hypothetical protein